MKLKMKALVASIALLGAVGANAAITNFNDAGGGSLMFTLWNNDNAVSSLFDLGLDTSAFTVANMSAAGTTVQWNFNTNTITGSSNVQSFIAGVSGDWASTYSTYAPNLTNSVYSVFAGDRTGPQAVAQY